MVIWHEISDSVKLRFLLVVTVIDHQNIRQGQAMALRHDVQSGAMNLKDKLAIELHSDMRHGKVIYGGEVLTARVCGQYIYTS